jgi:uncharacterized membrane protein YhaH (DUF805 family)
MREVERSGAGRPEKSRSLGMELLDAGLVVVGVVVGIMLLLSLVHAVVGVIGFLFKLVVLLAVVALIVRVFHHGKRRAA